MAAETVSKQDMERTLAQMTEADRGRLAASRQHVVEQVPQGTSIDRSDAGQLPVGRTPGVETKDLVARYGRGMARTPEREPEKEPDNDR